MIHKTHINAKNFSMVSMLPAHVPDCAPAAVVVESGAPKSGHVAPQEVDGP